MADTLEKKKRKKKKISSLPHEIFQSNNFTVNYIFFNGPMTMYKLANNTIMPSMKENMSLVVKIQAFQDFCFMPCILINMHDIDTKYNRDHLRAMGYLGTTYVMYPYVPFLRFRVYKLF